ncbi:hypothetical protein CNECB9_3580002 [Cupriavidus necator]|uniref:Uncharacterized protein n=1 Tax=Cupriavidus necator TaxID=106590 RepID=A0A1K0IJ13_CUPNE|nr:hypothetical protein CNECB9_3580002 [Cupriavidus necator]
MCSLSRLRERVGVRAGVSDEVRPAVRHRLPSPPAPLASGRGEQTGGADKASGPSLDTK